MPPLPPSTFFINHDDYHAKHVGRTVDGRQFFLTTPFVPGWHEFLALYLFDARGTLVEAVIDDLGPRTDLDLEQARRMREERLKELGPVKFGRIRVAPFQLERFGVTFGLVATPPEDPEEDWSVTVEPGNFMAFYPPWDGFYDT